MTIWTLITENAQALIVVFSMIAAVAAGIGIFFALPQLRAIRRTQELEAILSFLELTRRDAKDRKFVYKQLPMELEQIMQLSEEERKIAERAVASLNDIGLLLEEGTIPKKSFFGIYHTMIIRLCYKLQPYVKYRESRIGGRYGRRLERLAKRAKLYHDIHPKHRRTVVLLDSGKDTPISVYKTDVGRHLKKLLRIAKWFLRRLLSRY